jgi:peptidoglycan hydrolase-like protein with peptidoglycan-binding domain
VRAGTRDEGGNMSVDRVLTLVVLSCVGLTIAFAAPGASAQSSRTGGAGFAGRAEQFGDRIPLTAGMTGDDVSSLQQALTEAGFPVTVDGAFGAATEDALRNWERAGGRVFDGIVDAADAAALLAVLNGQAPLVTAPPDTAPPPPAGPVVASASATINSAGHAVAGAGSPIRVQRIIAAANHIATLPYRYGGGHGSFTDSAYDCSGSVSFALHGARLLDRTLDSTGLKSYGVAGPGRWVTVYANAGHTYMVVEGLRFDTSGATSARSRWQATAVSPRGFVARHPAGL